LIAGAVALVLVAIKLSVGFFSGSVVLIASAADSGLDFLVSVFNVYAIHTAGKPGTEDFNYGRGKLEGLASFLEGLVIAGSALLIIVMAVGNLIEERPIDHSDLAIGVMLISVTLTGGLVIYMRGVAERTGNLVVRADSLHYQVDLWTNLGILAGLAIIHWTGWFWLDGLIAIGIALYIFKEVTGLIREGVNMLLDRALDDALLEDIEAIIVAARPGIRDHHLLRTRRSANIYFVDVHLVFNRDTSLLAAHRRSEELEEKIRALDPDKTWEINTHLDPEDDSHLDVRDGLSVEAEAI